VFLGTHMQRLDDKGRLIVPAKFRDAFADGLVMTKSQEHALAVYPQADFLNKMSNLASAPNTLRQVRSYQRMVMAAASDDRLDSQGRVTIPPHLRAYAGLERDVVVIGAGDRAEIWDAETWNRYAEEQESDFSDMDGEFTAFTGT